MRRTIAPPWRPLLTSFCPLLVAAPGESLPIWQPFVALRSRFPEAAAGTAYPLPGGRGWRVFGPARRPRPARRLPPLADGVGASVPPLGGRGWRVVADSRRACVARRCCFLAGVYCGPWPLFGERVLRAVAAFWRARAARRCHFWRPRVARRSPSSSAAFGVSLIQPDGPGGRIVGPLWRSGLARLCPFAVAAAGASLPILGWRVWRAVAALWWTGVARRSRFWWPRGSGRCSSLSATFGTFLFVPCRCGWHVVSLPLAAAVGVSLPPRGGRVRRAFAAV